MSGSPRPLPIDQETSRRPVVGPVPSFTVEVRRRPRLATTSNPDAPPSETKRPRAALDRESPRAAAAAFGARKMDQSPVEVAASHPRGRILPSPIPDDRPAPTLGLGEHRMGRNFLKGSHGDAAPNDAFFARCSWSEEQRLAVQRPRRENRRRGQEVRRASACAFASFAPEETTQGIGQHIACQPGHSTSKLSATTA
jgi:hypothetical protein